MPEKDDLLWANRIDFEVSSPQLFYKIYKPIYISLINPIANQILNQLSYRPGASISRLNLTMTYPHCSADPLDIS